MRWDKIRQNNRTRPRSQSKASTHRPSLNRPRSTSQSHRLEGPRRGAGQLIDRNAVRWTLQERSADIDLMGPVLSPQQACGRRTAEEQWAGPCLELKRGRRAGRPLETKATNDDTAAAVVAAESIDRSIDRVIDTTSLPTSSFDRPNECPIHPRSRSN